MNTLVINYTKMQSAEDFTKQLKSAVAEFLEKNSEATLLHAFYRLDLPEEQCRSALRLTNFTIKADKITHLIIERLKKKMITQGIK